MLGTITCLVFVLATYLVLASASRLVLVLATLVGTCVYSDTFGACTLEC